MLFHIRQIHLDALYSNAQLGEKILSTMTGNEFIRNSFTSPTTAGMLFDSAFNQRFHNLKSLENCFAWKAD